MNNNNNFITDNAYLSFALPNTSTEVDVLLVYILLLVWINLVYSMSDHFITSHIASYDLYGLQT